MTADAVLLSENLREAMRFFGLARPEGEVREIEGLTLISSGLDYGVFNAAVLRSAVAIDTLSAFTKGLQRASEFFGERRLPWSLWLCEDRVERRARTRFQDAILGMNLRHLTSAPGMLAERLATPSRRSPELSARPVADQETRLAFAQITSLAFEIPLHLCRAVYGHEGAWQGPLAGWVGYAGDTAVCTAGLIVRDGAIGVYSVGTLPAYQKRGYAEALLRAAIGCTTARTGIERTLLQSTRAGMGLYQALGYRHITNFHVYLSKK
jgi:GNAT superfamily N-acetyltransferase